MLRDTVD
ncbi:hypothetical protein D018_4856A, partial [Vibrio parahaemolyticus VP2007-007]